MRSKCIDVKNSRKVSAFLSEKDQSFGMSFSQEFTNSPTCPPPARKSMMFFQSQNYTNTQRIKSAKNYCSNTVRQSVKNESPGNNKRNSESPNIKWIGVSPQNVDNVSFRQAFPVRRQKSEENSLGNFMLKYGKQLKMAKQKNNLTLHEGRDIWTNRGATNKLKPRLTWYDRKKPPQKQRNLFQQKKNNFQVNWNETK